MKEDFWVDIFWSIVKGAALGFITVLVPFLCFCLVAKLADGR